MNRNEINDRSAIIFLHKKGKSNVEIAKDLKISPNKVWRTVKRYQETGRVSDRPRSGRPRTKRTPNMIKSVREKIRRNPRRSMRKMALEANMGKTTMLKLVHNDLKMTPFKIQKRQLLSEVTKQKRRERGRVLLKKLTAGMQENLETGEVVWTDEKLFTVEPNFNQKNDMVLGHSLQDIPMHSRSHYRRQKPASVMVWAGVSETWKSPLIFIPEGCKINAKLYIDQILSPATTAAKMHFKNRPWTLQQDGASSHTAKISQNWCETNLNSFWDKTLWPPSSPDLNPMDFSI